MSDFGRTILSLLGFIIAVLVFIMIWTKIQQSGKKKLYRVKFSNGAILIDSLMDEKNSLDNDSIKYPKASIISYQEIKKKS